MLFSTAVHHSLTQRMLTADWSQEQTCNNWWTWTVLLSWQQCCSRLCLCQCMSHCPLTPWEAS